jgi:MFS superfamily sulfate permease-like transporter
VVLTVDAAVRYNEISQEEKGMIDAASQTNISPRLVRIERWMPGVRTLRTYKSAWLPRDLVSGAVLCALLVPQGMAYAELAGLPAITGLYTTVVCLLAYAAFGPSPFLILGPDSSLGPMIAAAILPWLLEIRITRLPWPGCLP